MSCGDIIKLINIDNIFDVELRRFEMATDLKTLVTKARRTEAARFAFHYYRRQHGGHVRRVNGLHYALAQHHANLNSKTKS